MRKITRLLWLVVVLGVSWNGSFAAEKAASGRSMLQVRELARELAVRDAVAEVDELVSRKVSYAAYGLHKALVACFNSRPYFWNSSYDWDDIEVARERAMNSCKNQADGCECKEVRIDDKVVLNVSEEAIDRRVIWLTRDRPPEDETLPPADPPKYAIDVVAEVLQIQERWPAPRDIAVQFPLNAPKYVRMDGVTCHFSYLCRCSGTLKIGFTKATAETTLALRLASKKGYTRCFENSKDVLGKPLNKPRQYCEFITYADRPENLLAPREVGTGELLRNFGYRQIDRIWMLSAVEVDEALVPVAPPLNTATPIYVESLGEAFKIHSLRNDGAGGCFISATFSNRIFYSESCISRDANCFERATDEFLKELRLAFAASPLLATPYTASPRPPGEYWFRRDKLRSEVLGGSPMREHSTYIVKWWRPYGMSHLSDVERSIGAAQGGPSVFADITSAILVAVGNDRFRDASDDEMPRFEMHVRQAAWNALIKSCATIRGKMAGDVCSLN